MGNRTGKAKQRRWTKIKPSPHEAFKLDIVSFGGEERGERGGGGIFKDIRCEMKDERRSAYLNCFSVLQLASLEPSFPISSALRRSHEIVTAVARYVM